MRSVFVLLLVLLLGLLPTVAVRAAGGHFDVDDATMLAPGRCQAEAWWADAPAEGTRLLHVGPGCRVGPVELGLNLEHADAGAQHGSSAGPQIKWVMDPIAPRLSAGVVWFAAAQRDAKPAQTAYAALTAFAGERLQTHANLGIDCAPPASCTRRWGGALEWAASDAMSVIGEHGRIAARATTRAGLRFNLNAATSLDVSAARVGDRRVGVVGINHEFAR